LAAALREEQAGAIQRIRRLLERCDRLLELGFAKDDGGAGRALREMRIKLRARSCVQFIASVQNRERLDLFAADRWDRLQPVGFRWV
jgi:hypothetical protein